MNLGNSLFRARKKSGLTQEEVAERLGVSRQTVSKWETGETMPDIGQSKVMSRLCKITLDELVDYEPDVAEIQEIIDRTDARTEAKIDWTKAWGKKYPVLLAYTAEVNVPYFAHAVGELLDELKSACGYGEQDAMLVLKDILYQVWKVRTAKPKK